MGPFDTEIKVPSAGSPELSKVPPEGLEQCQTFFFTHIGHISCMPFPSVAQSMHETDCTLNGGRPVSEPAEVYVEVAYSGSNISAVL